MPYMLYQVGSWLAEPCVLHLKGTAPYQRGITDTVMRNAGALDVNRWQLAVQPHTFVFGTVGHCACMRDHGQMSTKPQAHSYSQQRSHGLDNICMSNTRQSLFAPADDTTSLCGLVQPHILSAARAHWSQWFDA